MTINRYYYKELEPVHAGAGGFRLGRVDKTIQREPGTQLPKVAGTSISGAARAYAALAIQSPESAGQAKYDARKHAKCPVFFTFGHANDAEGGNAGQVAVGDAHILFFPVASMKGMTFITSVDVLENAGIQLENAPTQNQFGVNFGIDESDFNLAWLWVQKREQVRVSLPNFPNALNFLEKKRIVIVPERMLTALVNSQLEVRTSVSISPITGTAEGTALFVYEAIPRFTILTQEVVVDAYRDGGKVPDNKKNWKGPLEVLEHGLTMIGTFGVGGMGNKGFGRMELIRGGA